MRGPQKERKANRRLSLQRERERTACVEQLLKQGDGLRSSACTHFPLAPFTLGTMKMDATQMKERKKSVMYAGGELTRQRRRVHVLVNARRRVKRERW